MSGKNLAKHVEDRRIAVDGERQGRMQSATNERGCSLIFAKRGHFEPEEREDHPPCRMSVSISDSDGEVRGVFGVPT